ncbi:MAG: hypothetical protein COA39_002515 [Sulfurimonas sp.]|nr:hypothetical protein [Sulfurimonas sp.]
MKRREQSLSKSFKPMKIYYDDIEELYSIFKEHPEEVKIEADEFELDNLKEILKIKKDYFTNLKIYAHRPYVSLDFSKSDIRLYISDDSPLQRGLYEKLNTVLQPKERIFLSNIIKFIDYMLSPIIFGLSFLIDNIILRTIIQLGSAIWWILGFIYNFKLTSKIIPFRKLERPNFFQRNKDQMITSIVSAIIGGAIVLFLTKWLEK